ncbi:hypothetical protein BS47DRAFT_1352319, partial [Hydnum rufescens UP504]
MTNLVSTGENPISPRPNHAPRPAKAALHLPQPPGQPPLCHNCPRDLFSLFLLLCAGPLSFPDTRKEDL